MEQLLKNMKLSHQNINVNKYVTSCCAQKKFLFKVLDYVKLKLKSDHVTCSGANYNSKSICSEHTILLIYLKAKCGNR